jgi:imidazolonepropionase-like amidohydrolase
MRTIKLLVRCVVFLTLSPAVLYSQSPSRSNAVVFEGARLIVGDGTAPIENGLLVVRSGRIAAVGRKGGVTIPPGAARVDLSGKTVSEAPIPQ